MKVSLKWLKEYISLPESLSIKEITDKLTFAGLEVEAIHSKAQGLEKVFVGEILEIKPHPNADRLQLTKISVGDALGPGTILSIVCGAKNIVVGQKIPVATIGALLPNGIEIKESKIRGELSQGMLCSSDELKLSGVGDSQGIFILDPNAKLGDSFAKYMGFDDVVLEINITPNRGDALSHLGVARDLSALFSLPLQIPKVNAESGEKNIPIELKNEVGMDCPAYFARAITGVRVGDSPAWLKEKIESLGLRSVNNIVDATTFVMLEMGQPIHAFDADTITESGKINIHIANGRENENFSTISHRILSLSSADLVIRAGVGGNIPAALAGVMGSDRTEVTKNTKNILLESAEFASPRVRRMNRSHALLTDAAYRFERGIDSAKITWALDRVASIIIEIAGGTLGEMVFTEESIERKNKIASPIALTNQDIENCLGVSPGPEKTKKILEQLGFTVEIKAEVNFECIAPSWRGDIIRKEDLIEEIGRIWGYEHIQSSLPAGLLTYSMDAFPRENQKNKIRSWLCGEGFFEALNYGFSSCDLEAFFLGKQSCDAMPRVEGTEGKEVEALKVSLIPGLIRNLSHNLSHMRKNIRFFEIRTTFHTKEVGKIEDKNKEFARMLDTRIQEKEVLSLVCTGAERDYDWTNEKSNFDFFSIKGIVEGVLEVVGKKGIQWETSGLAEFLHPKQSATLVLGNRNIGFCGRLHPLMEKKINAVSSVWIVEIELDKILSAKNGQEYSYKPYSKFPLVERDFSITVESSITAKKIQDLIKKVASPMFHDFMIFDVYQGERIPPGHISYAFRVWLGASDHTLADEEIVSIHTKIMQNLEKSFSARFAGL